MLVETKARVGVFAIALGAYLPQFPSLVPEFEGQYADFKKRIPDTVELIDGGIVTTKELAQAAGDKFRSADVDLVILQLLTYATSYNMLPAVRDLDVPVVLVDLQKKKAPDYANTDTATWLGELYACGAVGEMVADLERAAALLGPDFDVEIVERHHRRKLDAPSGTALMLADAAGQDLPYEPEYVFDRHAVRKARDGREIGISSVRGGTIVGDHTVLFAGRDEVIEISHHAASREIFANGAVQAAKFLATVDRPGLYSMADIIK